MNNRVKHLQIIYKKYLFYHIINSNESQMNSLKINKYTTSLNIDNIFV